jgi:hypothetical protein
VKNKVFCPFLSPSFFLQKKKIKGKEKKAQQKSISTIIIFPLIYLTDSANTKGEYNIPPHP